MEKLRNVSLPELYYGVDECTAFSSGPRIKNVLKKRNLLFKPSDVDNWLKAQPTHTLHKPRRIHFSRNKYNLGNIGDFWQADLMDMQGLSRKNKGFKYILAVIDCFSKYAWCIPIKKKTPDNIIQAFKSIFAKCSYKPYNIHTDKGREFVNKPFQEFLAKNGVTFFRASDPVTKAAICERYIRTMKMLIYKYFTYTRSQKYCDVLESLVTVYNNRYHRSIGMSPAAVNENNVLQVWEKLHKSCVKKKPTLKRGDFVRLAKTKEVFDKGYKPTWTEEIFTVNKVIPHTHPVYKIQDLEGYDISGVFYEPELQKVLLPR